MKTGTFVEIGPAGSIISFIDACTTPSFMVGNPERAGSQFYYAIRFVPFIRTSSVVRWFSIGPWEIVSLGKQNLGLVN